VGEDSEEAVKEGKLSSFPLALTNRFGKDIAMRFLCALFFLGAFSLSAADETVLQSATLLQAAKKDFRSGNFDSALSALDRIDKGRSENVESLDLRGTIYFEQGRLDEAKKAFRAAHEADGANFSPRLHLADILLREKKFAEARDIYGTLLKETNIQESNERLRYAMLLTYLFARDENGARSALARIKFPTESPAYYYAQAAWEFAHDHKKEAQKWISAADRIFDAKTTAWFARPLYDSGWLKEKPVLVAP
jgi:predicted Zn-dependent protease